MSNYDVLRKAQIDELLINVYQINSGIVYTGQIKYLSSVDLIMDTYNDYGLQDGEVYLKLAGITDVETDSFDIDSMKGRIAFDQDRAFQGTPAIKMPIGLSDDLFTKVIQSLQQTNNLALVVTTTINKLIYNEGIITEITDDSLELDNVDKFNFSTDNQSTIKFTDIIGIEFGGNELTLLKNSLEMVVPQNHHADVTITDRTKFADVAKAAEDRQQLIIIETNDDRKYFYVGKIIASNPTELIIQVVDMSGRFGGYVWVRYDDIKRFVLDADYLKLVAGFIQHNRDNGTYVFPGLNDQRAFDDGDNLLVNILSQAVHFNKVLRFELSDSQNFLGYPVTFNSQTGIITVRMLEEITDDGDQTNEEEIGIESIKEMAFDYFKAYLLENQVE